MERTDLIFKQFKRIYQIFFILTLVVMGRIIFIQYVGSDKDEQKGEALSYKPFVVKAVRGNILSYDGKTLATSVPYYQIRMDCLAASDSIFKLNVDSLSICLAAFFKDKSKDEYKKLITDGRKNKKRYLAIGSRKVDYSELAAIKKFPLFRLGANTGGLIQEEKYERRYPFGHLAYRTIGFINSLGEGTGIETAYDHYLKGDNGVQIRQRREGGEWVPINGGQNVLPNDGYDIRTTINIDFQEAAEEALREQITKGYNVEGGTAVVMECATGAIRAIANLKRDGKGGFDETLNYAVGQATEPGSVLKLVTLVAILEDGKVTLDSPVECGGGVWEYMGQKVTDSHAVGSTNVKGAFAHSSNVGFAKLATSAYKDDIEGYTKRLNDMKIGEKFNLDIRGEGIALIHNAQYITDHPGLLASMGFGYGMTLTPLHTLTFYNAIANDGKMMKPYFIESFEKNGEVVKQFSPTVISGSICSKETAQKAKEALRAVVTEGTGKFINNERYHVSGKTGTARGLMDNGKYEKNGLRRYQATFCGFFPTEKPLYSIIVVLYSGAIAGTFYGASQAGPPFRYITDFIYANSPQLKETLNGTQKGRQDSQPKISTGKGEESALVISQLPIAGKASLVQGARNNGFVKFSKEEDGLKVQNANISTDSTVSVIGMGLKDALYLLEGQGYRVKAIGAGKVVGQQIYKSSDSQKPLAVLTLSNRKQKEAPVQQTEEKKEETKEENKEENI